MSDSTREEIEAAAKAMFETPDSVGDYTWAEMVTEDPVRAEIWREDAKRVLAAAAVSRPAPAETPSDEVASEVASQGLPEGTTLQGLIEHHRANAGLAVAMDALAVPAPAGEGEREELADWLHKTHARWPADGEQTWQEHMAEALAAEFTVTRKVVS